METTRKREIAVEDSCVASRENKKQKVEFCPFQLIPVEILGLILSFVPCFCTPALRLVCMLWGLKAEHHHRTPDLLGFQYNKHADMPLSPEAVQRSTAGLAPFLTKDLRGEYGDLITWGETPGNGFRMQEVISLLAHTAGRGRLEDLQWLCDHRFAAHFTGGDRTARDDISLATCIHGRGRILRWLAKRRCLHVTQHSLNCVMQYGHEALMRYFVQHTSDGRFFIHQSSPHFGADRRGIAMIGAILTGRTDALTYFLLKTQQKVSEWMTSIARWGAELGCIEAIRWVFCCSLSESWPISLRCTKKRALEYWPVPLDAKKTAALEVQKLGMPVDDKLLDACGLGVEDIRKVNRTSSVGVGVTSLVLKAICNGHSECARAIHGLRDTLSLPDERLSGYARRENPVSHDRISEVCLELSKKSDMEGLEWFRERGYPWNDNLTALAAKNDDLEMLVWARERGCPWDKRVYEHAGNHANREILRYALDNDCPTTRCKVCFPPPEVVEEPVGEDYEVSSSEEEEEM